MAGRVFATAMVGEQKLGVFAFEAADGQAALAARVRYGQTAADHAPQQLRLLHSRGRRASASTSTSARWG